jgi:hypothetical protein
LAAQACSVTGSGGQSDTGTKPDSKVSVFQIGFPGHAVKISRASACSREGWRSREYARRRALSRMERPGLQHVRVSFPSGQGRGKMSQHVRMPTGLQHVRCGFYFHPGKGGAKCRKMSRMERGYNTLGLVFISIRAEARRPGVRRGLKTLLLSAYACAAARSKLRTTYLLHTVLVRRDVYAHHATLSLLAS